jgi:hypothetical protein
MNGVRRRVEKLEHVRATSDRFRSVEHRINFIGSDGRVSSTLLLSENRHEWIHYEVSEGRGKEASEGA